MTLFSVLLFFLYEDTESLVLSNLPRATQRGSNRAGIRVQGCLVLDLRSLRPWVRVVWHHQRATGQEVAGVAMKFDVGRRKLPWSPMLAIICQYAVLSEERLLESKSGDHNAYWSTARLVLVNLCSIKMSMYV